MQLRLDVIPDDLRRKIHFLGIVLLRRILVATNEKTTADGERAAHFEKVPGGNIVNFQDLRRLLRRLWIVPRVIGRFAVAEEGYREGLLSLVGFSDFSKPVVLYSGLVHKFVRCRDDVSLCESGDVDLAPGGREKKYFVFSFCVASLRSASLLRVTVSRREW